MVNLALQEYLRLRNVEQRRRALDPAIRHETRKQLRFEPGNNHCYAHWVAIGGQDVFDREVPHPQLSHNTILALVYTATCQRLQQFQSTAR